MPTKTKINIAKISIEVLAGKSRSYKVEVKVKRPSWQQFISY